MDQEIDIDSDYEENSVDLFDSSGFLLPQFNKSLEKSDFESSDQKSCLDFFSRNDAYSFPENQIFQKRHQINPNTAKWIFFPEMTLPDVPKRVWIFFPKMTLAHFPDFRE